MRVATGYSTWRSCSSSSSARKAFSASLFGAGPDSAQGWTRGPGISAPRWDPLPLVFGAAALDRLRAVLCQPLRPAHPDALPASTRFWCSAFSSSSAMPARCRWRRRPSSASAAMSPASWRRGSAFRSWRPSRYRSPAPVLLAVIIARPGAQARGALFLAGDARHRPGRAAARHSMERRDRRHQRPCRHPARSSFRA